MNRHVLNFCLLTLLFIALLPLQSSAEEVANIFHESILLNGPSLQVSDLCPVIRKKLFGHPGSKEATIACQGVMNSIDLLKKELLGQSVKNDFKSCFQYRKVLVESKNPARLVDNLIGTRLVDLRRALVLIRDQLPRVAALHLPLYIEATQELVALDQMLRDLKITIRQNTQVINNMFSDLSNFEKKCGVNPNKNMEIVTGNYLNRKEIDDVADFIVEQGPGQALGALQMSVAQGLAFLGAVETAGYIVSAPVGAGIILVTSSKRTNEDEAITEKFIRELYRDGFEEAQNENLDYLDAFRLQFLRSDLVFKRGLDKFKQD